MSMRSFLFGLLALLPLSTPLSATSQEEVLSANILAGWQTKSGQMAALRFDLAPGWKTYWRSPGEAGIPPQFDWSGSENLKSIRLIWPKPSVFETNGMQTIGYHESLVLPVELIAKDPSKPIKLAAHVEMGICQDICLPAEVMLRAELIPAAHENPAIKGALARQALSGRAGGVQSITCEIEPIKDGLRVTARLTLPPQGGTETVTVEAADPAIWVSEAESHRKGNALIAVAELVPPSGKPFALERQSLTLTVLSQKAAIEVIGCPAP